MKKNKNGVLLKCEKDNDGSFTTGLGSKTELMAEVEHNRWNVEKLLLGYRVYTSEERKTDEDARINWEDYMKKNKINYGDIEVIRDKKEKNENEQQHIDEYEKLRKLRKENENTDFAHNAIRPYKDLDDGNKRYDIFMTGNIPNLIILFNKLKDKKIKKSDKIFPLSPEENFVLDDYIIRQKKPNQVIITLLNKNHHIKNKSLWIILLNLLSNRMHKVKKMCSSAIVAPE